MSSAFPITAFIGGGNMAASLIGGLLRSGRSVASIRVAETDTARALELATRFNVATAPCASDIVGEAGLVVLAVKPQQMAQALDGLSLEPGTVVLSIAAGQRIATLRAALGESAIYVRSMPNTPALLGCGMSALYADAGTPELARAQAQAVLDAVGKTCWVEREEDLDAVTAVSGSGPAYVFLLVELMQQAGVVLGLPAETAALLARETLVGAARMIQDSGQAPEALRAQVTSKGGTTAAALESLEQAGLRSIFVEALAAAARRSRELGQAAPH